MLLSNGSAYGKLFSNDNKNVKQVMAPPAQRIMPGTAWRHRRNPILGQQMHACHAKYASQTRANELGVYGEAKEDNKDAVSIPSIEERSRSSLVAQQALANHR